MDSIRQKLSSDLKTALTNKDTVSIKTIRTLMAAIDNAEAVPIGEQKIETVSGTFAGATPGLGSTEVARKDLSKEEVQQIIQKEIDELLETIKLISTNSTASTDEYHQKINILKKYLLNK